MKINYSTLMILVISVTSLEAVDNNSRGIHKKKHSKISRLSPELHEEAIKLLRQMKAKIERLDEKLEELEQCLFATNSALTQIKQLKK